MLTINYPQLTQEQIELIPIYRHKWQEIACLAERIDREQARLAITKAYEFIDLAAPNIIFFSSPSEALEYIYSELNKNWGKLANTPLSNPIGGKLTRLLLGNIRNQIQGEILKKLQGNLDGDLADNIASEIARKIEENRLFSIVWANFGELARNSSQNTDANDISKSMFNFFFEAGFIFNNYLSLPLWQVQRSITSFFSGNSPDDSNLNQIFGVVFTGNFEHKNQAEYQLPFPEVSSNFTNVVVPSVIADYGYYIDYCHEVLNCDRDETKWNIFYNLITNCGWIFPYEKTAIVCQRITRIDDDNDLG